MKASARHLAAQQRERQPLHVDARMVSARHPTAQPSQDETYGGWRGLGYRGGRDDQTTAKLCQAVNNQLNNACSRGWGVGLHD